MVTITINNQAVRAAEGQSILEAARAAGIDIPSLCYYQGLRPVGACRVCVVEAADGGALLAACNTPVAEGMTVYTDSPRARAARRVNLELILSAHEVSCPTCARGGNCALQKLAEDLNIRDVPYARTHVRAAGAWPENAILARDASKCVHCLRCVSVCRDTQGLGVWESRGTGARAAVGVKDGAEIQQSDCVICGQCITHCPVGALYARDDTQKVLDAISDPTVKVVAQIAPAIRAAWGEGLGLSRERATVGRLVAAVRKLGVDYVFDTNFAADLTITEEASELLERLSHKDRHAWPMFTSCCPGWTRFVKGQYPDMAGHLSTAKSPQQMFGAAAKTWFAQRAGLDAEKIFSVSIMPCTAKKAEADMNSDVDAVITNRELIQLLKGLPVDIAGLDEEAFDSPLGASTGAGVIFGATGGVMEAALRSAHYYATGKNPDPDAFAAVRGDGTREATVSINGVPVRAAVVCGLAQTRALLEKIKSGEAAYDFVEVMACPGGCVGGGGQPITDGRELAAERAPVLYALDADAPLRFSHENPAVQTAYKEFFIKPLSQVSHTHLHVI